MPSLSVNLSLGWCDVHEKLSYSSRKRARKSSRSHPENRKGVFPCDAHEGLWHVGGLPREVIAGDLTRDEFFARWVA